MPYMASMSSTRQPRTSSKRSKKTHHITKKIRLFSAMKPACIRNAPRNAIDAFRFVASRARRKRKVLRMSATIDRESIEASPIHQDEEPEEKDRPRREA